MPSIPKKPKKVGNPNKKTRGKKEAYIDEGNQRMRVFKRAQNKILSTNNNWKSIFKSTQSNSNYERNDKR
jgi:hypothetical protein